jgi:hypothetical protein
MAINVPIIRPAPSKPIIIKRFRLAATCIKTLTFIPIIGVRPDYDRGRGGISVMWKIFVSDTISGIYGKSLVLSVITRKLFALYPHATITGAALR